MENILVTGGSGYIGSHTVLELLNANFDVVVLDNLSNSSKESIVRIEKLTGKKVTFIEGDLSDKVLLKKLFEKYPFKHVIHFAGLKAVGESVANPLTYYRNNVAGTLSLLEVMNEANCKSFVFSSSATVYGNPETLPLTEDMPRSATNPYGRSKLIIEEILEDIYTSDPTWRIVCLRYFNPVGAHESGEIGEDPTGIPNNLMPFISQVACGRRSQLVIFGNDYPTPDGTGVRDYIHVVDLAKGHLATLHYLQSLKKGVWEAINLGTGQGISVLKMVAAFEQASEKAIPYTIEARREGDVATYYANAEKALQKLNWKAELNIVSMCASTWKWQEKNPNGYT